MGGKYENGRVASLESVPILLNSGYLQLYCGSYQKQSRNVISQYISFRKRKYVLQHVQAAIMQISLCILYSLNIVCFSLQTHILA